MSRLPDPPGAAAARFRLALAMMADGIAIMREKLKRKYPEATDDEIRSKLRDWLQERPLPGEGDPAFRPRRRFPR